MSMKERDNPNNIIGADNADNGYSSTNVAANADGSIIERLEDLKANGITDTDISAILVDTGTTLPATLGTPTDTDLATDIANVQTEVDKIDALDTVADAILVDTGTTIPATLGTPTDTDLATDIANVQTEVDKIGTPAGADVSTDIATIDTVVDAIKAVTDYETQIATKSISSVASGDTNLFDLVGEIELESIIGIVTTATEDAACTYKFDFYDGTTETDLCTATSIQDKAIGTNLSITGTVANALVVTAGNISVGQAGKLKFSDAGDTGNGKIRGVSDAAITGVVTFIAKYKKISSDGALSASA